MIRVPCPQQSREHSEERESTNTEATNKCTRPGCLLTSAESHGVLEAAGLPQRCPEPSPRASPRPRVPITASLQKEIEIEGRSCRIHVLTIKRQRGVKSAQAHPHGCPRLPGTPPPSELYPVWEKSPSPGGMKTALGCLTGPAVGAARRNPTQDAHKSPVFPLHFPGWTLNRA